MRRLLILLACASLLAPALAAASPRVLALPGPDAEALRLEDKARDDDGPERFAWPHDLQLQADDGAGWDRLPDGSHRWQLDVQSPGSLSLCFGFDRFRLPWGGELRIVGQSGPERVYTAADMQDHGQLWTPVVLGDAARLILTLPAGHRDEHELRLVRVGRGYRFFGEPMDEKQGDCNIDVICPEGEAWRKEIRSVGVYQLGASWKCTGVMVNNTARDETPYFLTAYHCDVAAGNAASVVLYWNYESPVCGDLDYGSLADTQSGAIWRAGYPSTDMTLLELIAPPDTSWHVTYAGWDRSSTPAVSAVCIHHPGTDEKAISFENDPLEPTGYTQYVVNPSFNHWRVVDWDLGTTEGGSSGSPLFNPQHRIVGQLHGGYAACGNDASDWYGRFDLSWAGGGTTASQLAHWLDPAGLGSSYLNTLDPLDPDDPGEPEVPDVFAMRGVWGNPVKSGQTAVVRFDLPRAGHVKLTVFDVRGRRVATLVDRTLEAASHPIPWSSQGVAAGVYLLRLEALGEEETRAITVLR